MKVPEQLKPQGGRFNLTPMIDVVFLLIIFFIVSNNMIQQDNAVFVDLPAAETGILPKEQQTKRLTISIEHSGMLYIGATLLDESNLRRIMIDCQKNWKEEAEILIRSDRLLPYGKVKPILQTAAEVGILRVTFAVKKQMPSQ